jgi:hypothetical protein
MKLQLNAPISLSSFIHDSSKQCFYQEDSSLGKYNYFQQIYDDACDVGFLVRNPGTNRTILVSLFKTNVEMNDDDGDVVSWVFTPSSESVRLYPKLRNYKFVIYND